MPHRKAPREPRPGSVGPGPGGDRRAVGERPAEVVEEATGVEPRAVRGEELLEAGATQCAAGVGHPLDEGLLPRVIDARSNEPIVWLHLVFGDRGVGPEHPRRDPRRGQRLLVADDAPLVELQVGGERVAQAEQVEDVRLRAQRVTDDTDAVRRDGPSGAARSSRNRHGEEVQPVRLDRPPVATVRTEAEIVGRDDLAALVAQRRRVVVRGSQRGDGDHCPHCDERGGDEPGGHRNNRHRPDQQEHRRQQEPRRHEVATHADDEQRVHDRSDREYDQDGDGALPSSATQPQQQRHVQTDDERNEGKPQRVVVEDRLVEVVQPRGPVVAGSFFGDRGVGDEARVVAHAEDLVRDGERTGGAEQCDASSPIVGSPLLGDDNREEQERQHGELRPHQRAETEHDCGPGAEAPVVARPGREHEQAAAEPRVRQTVLEPGRREPPRAWERRDDERAGRQPHGAIGETALEPYGAGNCQDQAAHREHDAGHDRDPFEAEGRHEVDEQQRGDPQRAGRGLDPFAGVEHRPVAGLDLAHDAQVDEAVVVHVVIGPPPDREHHDG